MTYRVGTRTGVLPVAIIVYELGNVLFAQPCYSADEHLAFVRDMSEAYPEFSFKVYDSVADDESFLNSPLNSPLS